MTIIEEVTKLRDDVLDMEDSGVRFIDVRKMLDRMTIPPSVTIKILRILIHSETNADSDSLDIVTTKSYRVLVYVLKSLS